MKTFINQKPVKDSNSLQSLFDDLVGCLPQSTPDNRIFVRNEITSELKLQADREVVLPIIQDLLNTVVSNARDTCISISAEKFRDVLIVRMTDRNNYNGYALSFGLLSVGRHARSIGGEVSIEGAQKKVTTITFSFPDTPELANMCPFGAMA